MPCKGAKSAKSAKVFTSPSPAPLPPCQPASGLAAPCRGAKEVKGVNRFTNPCSAPFLADADWQISPCLTHLGTHVAATLNSDLARRGGSVAHFRGHGGAENGQSLRKLWRFG